MTTPDITSATPSSSSKETEPDIELRAVDVRYGPAKSPQTVLSSVELTVRQGEFVVLVGPSGCGKTTLLRLVAGLERPASGTVAVRRKVGVVFQQPRLFPWRTVGGNLAFALARHGVVRAERAARIEELLTLVGLPGMARRRTWELSGGQQQRVAIARALATEPQVLLMDEPFAALDALTRERLQEEVRTLAAVTGTTVLFVTHSPEEAVLLGSRVVVLAAGPGRVVDEVPIPLPRSAEATGTTGTTGTTVAALREDPRFASLRDDLATATRARSAANQPARSAS